VYALNGANGAVLWQTPMNRVIGSVVTADLGSGYQDVLAPTTNGVVVLDGKTGSVITTLQADTGFQNSPLITDDPNGTVGITLAGLPSRRQHRLPLRSRRIERVPRERTGGVATVPSRPGADG
jgi:outer membrane protein assembly factor BamB